MVRTSIMHGGISTIESGYMWLLPIVIPKDLGKYYRTVLWEFPTLKLMRQRTLRGKCSA